MVITLSITWLYQEIGLSSLWGAGGDAWLIIAARSCRMIAFGTNSLILALFFAALDFSDTYIGLFMTLTLLGDVLLSLLLTTIADRIGRRRILIAGSGLMVMSGAIFAFFENYWLLLLAAVSGVLSATGSDFGPFRAIEESILSTLTDSTTRADVLAWYVTSATLGQTIGTEASGRLIHFLEGLEGWSVRDAYHAAFLVYSGVGVLNICFILCLSNKCEIQLLAPAQTEEARGLLGDQVGDEIEPAHDPSIDAVSKTGQSLPKRSIFSEISRDTRSAMYKLWFLLIVDSIADGMVPYALTTYYMDQKFHLPKSTLGDIVSTSYFLSFVSTLFAAPLSRRLGLINTMVFTHLPSSLAVLLFPFPPGIVLTVILLFIRTGLNNMDQAPRSAFIAAVVRPQERTTVMGITNMVRTLASAAGPTLTGILAGNQRFWIAFLVAGSLRTLYDLGLFAMFINMKLYQHEQLEYRNRAAVDPRQSAAEEEIR